MVTGSRKLLIVAASEDPVLVAHLGAQLRQVRAWTTELVEVSNLRQIRAELVKRTVDVIIVDDLIDGLSGSQAIGELMNQPSPPAAILLTQCAEEDAAAAVSRVGADDYLVKADLTPDMLRRAIQGALDRRSLAEENALLAEELSQSQKMETIGTLTGGIAHDINNLLTAIMGYLELAVTKIQEQEAIDEVREARSVCQRMAELVQRLVGFSRRGSPEKKPVRAAQIVHEVETILRHTIPKGIAIRTELSCDGLVLNANAMMVHQILLNLCLNGCEAMPAGGDLTIGSRRVTLDEDFIARHPGASCGDHILFSVRDTGTGMDEATIARIFQPFFTTKQPGPGNGVGLGLVVVSQNVKSHRGVITVRSAPGEGTTFGVYLPAGQTEREETDTASQSAVTVPGGHETILLVDDERVLRDVGSRMLELLGYRVSVASDGVEALETYAQAKDEISVVLLDISMPRMSGEECLARLLEIDPNVRVIFASGRDMNREAPRLTSLGARGVIQKPYDSRGLARELRATIDEGASNAPQDGAVRNPGSTESEDGSMFERERDDFKFQWDHLGDINLGRPNLGPYTHVALYRLMQFTLRDAMIRHLNVRTTNRVFFDAGYNAGRAAFEHLLKAPKGVNELVRTLQQCFEELGGGIIRVEEADEQKPHFVLTVAEDLDCSGLPATGEVICTYDEGFLAGVLESSMGRPLTVREVDCWCTGERVCRFEASAREDKEG